MRNSLFQVPSILLVKRIRKSNKNVNRLKMICRWIKSPVLDWMNKFFWIQLVANCIGFMNIGMSFQVFFTMETFQTNFLLSVHCRKKQDRHQCRARYLTSFHVINSYRLIRRWRKNWNCLVNDFVTSIVDSLFGPVISCRTWSISLLLLFFSGWYFVSLPNSNKEMQVKW